MSHEVRFKRTTFSGHFEICYFISDFEQLFTSDTKGDSLKKDAQCITDWSVDFCRPRTAYVRSGFRAFGVSYLPARYAHEGFSYNLAPRPTTNGTLDSNVVRVYNIRNVIMFFSWLGWWRSWAIFMPSKTFCAYGFASFRAGPPTQPHLYAVSHVPFVICGVLDRCCVRDFRAQKAPT